VIRKNKNLQRPQIEKEYYALNYTVNIIYFVPHIPPIVTQQPQRVDMMGGGKKNWTEKKILY
jgi:hypothetical protein